MNRGVTGLRYLSQFVTDLSGFPSYFAVQHFSLIWGLFSCRK